MHDLSTRYSAELAPIAAAPALSAALTPGERLAAYGELAKAKLSLMAVLAVAAGYLQAGGAVDLRMVALLLGAFLMSAASSFLNQFQEAEHDVRMVRTRGRPLPSGRIGDLEALISGMFLGLVGFLVLQGLVHPTAAAVGAAILVGYNLAYTPLKRLTEVNTFVGAVVGALPVVLGAAAVDGRIGEPAQQLFAILFLWQLPHFWAIAWLHREDYRRGGFYMLSRNDQDGRLSGLSTLLGVLLLLPVSLVPSLSGVAGPIYFYGALMMGLAWGGLCAAFAWSPSDLAARRVFRASLVYLPALLMLLLADKAGV
jgi:protoheme IX farnesyltransferase